MDPRDVAVRFSHLKRFALSAAHYLSALEEEREDTASLRLGRLGHAITLRGIEAFAVYEGDRRGNKWKEYQAEHDGKDIVTQKEFDLARRIADAVWANPDAAGLLNGPHEVKVPWKIGDRACHSTIDCIGATWVSELKTTRLAAPGWFRHEALKRHYHAQLAWYRDAARYVKHDTREGYIVAVETSPPFAVTTFELTTRAIEEGAKLCRLWFEQLLVSEQCGRFPAYSDAMVPLDVEEDLELVYGPEEPADVAVGF